MSLDNLSPELLTEIISYIPSDFFQQDVGRLTISKRWYPIAWPQSVRELHVSAKSLTGFLEFVRRIPQVAKKVIFLEIKLELPKELWLDESQDGVWNWLENTETTLLRAGSLIQSCTMVREYKLELFTEWNMAIESLDMPQPFLDVDTMMHLVPSSSHLTSLHIDTAGTTFMSDTGNLNGPLCGIINRLLPTLQRLRVRTGTLCDQLLALPQKSAELGLEEVLINLSLPTVPEAILRNSTRPCGGGSGIDFLDRNHSSVELQAIAFAGRLNNPRKVRVISHVMRSPKLFSFDAVTKQRMMLPPDAEWDADGEIVDDPQILADLGFANHDDDADSVDE